MIKETRIEGLAGMVYIIIVKHNKYMQKAGEPENDAGFLKHILVFGYTSMASLSGS